MKRNCPSDEVAKRSSSEKIRRMHKKIQGIRLSEERGVKYMQKWEERVYDRLDGKAEENVEAIRAYYEAVAASPDKTAEDIVEGLLGDLS